MTVEWIDPGLRPRPVPLLLPQEVYAEIMALPDGADLTRYFEYDDPAWLVKELRLRKIEGEGERIHVVSVMELELELEAAPPAGAQPGTESGVEGWAIDSAW